MKAVQYIFINAGLDMSGPKTAAMTAHAAIASFRSTVLRGRYDGRKLKLLKEWEATGEMTVILEARDAEHLRSIKDFLDLKDFASTPIIDEGRTEVPSHSFTALGVEIVDKDDPLVAAAFSDFRTLKDRPRVANPEPPRVPAWLTRPRVRDILGG
jgi:peptidyl-tRNA hydrolase